MRSGSLWRALRNDALHQGHGSCTRRTAWPKPRINSSPKGHCSPRSGKSLAPGNTCPGASGSKQYLPPNSHPGFQIPALDGRLSLHLKWQHRVVRGGMLHRTGGLIVCRCRRRWSNRPGHRSKPFSRDTLCCSQPRRLLMEPHKKRTLLGNVGPRNLWPAPGEARDVVCHRVDVGFDSAIDSTTFTVGDASISSRMAGVSFMLLRRNSAVTQKIGAVPRVASFCTGRGSTTKSGTSSYLHVASRPRFPLEEESCVCPDFR
jgi:hypothetical protein